MNKDVKIDIIFSTTQSLVSWYLRSYFGMNTPFSHVCLKIHSDHYQRTIIYEANGKGIRAEEYSLWDQRNKTIFKFPLRVTAQRKYNMIQYCIDNLGKEYGHDTIWYHILDNKFGIPTKLGFDGNKKMMCSEFVYEICKDEINFIYEALGYIVPESIELVHPKALYELLVEYKLSRTTPNLG
jgi:uncharacterized protein YycO